MSKLTVQQWGRIIGCRVYFSETHPFEDKVEETKFKLAGIRIDGEHISLSDDQHNDYNAAYCKPILRTFDQMTEEEWLEFRRLEELDANPYMIYPNGMYSCTKECCTSENLCSDTSQMNMKTIDYLDSIYVAQRGEHEAGLAIKEGEDEYIQD